MKRMAVLPIVVVLALATFVTALAAGPLIIPFEYDDTYELVYCGDFGAGDFWIWNNEVGSGTDKLWFDKDDNLIRVKFHVGGVDHLYADFDPDNIVTGHFVVNGDLRFDAETGEPTLEHLAGNPWNIQLPGSGNVFHIAGTAFFENGEFVKQAGLVVEDFETLCQYFAP